MNAPAASNSLDRSLADLGRRRLLTLTVALAGVRDQASLRGDAPLAAVYAELAARCAEVAGDEAATLRALAAPFDAECDERP